MKLRSDRNYEGVDDNGEPVAPFTSYDRELDFNRDPQSEYEPETDEDWGGVDEDEEEQSWTE
jgi:hypothetical protein